MNGPRRIAAPSFDPENAATKAMTQYDANRDGFLDAEELDKCPALKNALKQLDTDGDGRLSREELLHRLQQFKKTDVGVFSTTVKVRMDGEPLVGALVEMEPEPFMGSSIKPAQGTTDDSGRALMRIAGPEPPGCNFGFYRVRISQKDASGEELVPDHFQGTLGIEVPNSSGGGTVFSLTRHKGLQP